MDKKYRVISMICGMCGIIGGILMIVAAIMENRFPRPLWFVASVCMLINSIGIAMNYRYISKHKEEFNPKDSK